MSAFDDSAPNLKVVDEAFGPVADLYTDVLGVQPNASSGQIQHAYFDRRDELFKLLGDIDADQEQDSITASHRFHAERKLDAVVMAVRILGDPELRLQYDDMRHERLQGTPVKTDLGEKSGSGRAKSRSSSSKKKHASSEETSAFSMESESVPHSKHHHSHRSSRRSKKEYSSEERALRKALSHESTPSDEGGALRKKKSKGKSRKITPDAYTKRHHSHHKKQRELMIDETDSTTFSATDDEDGATVLTYETEGTLIRESGPARFLTKVKQEVAGAIDDTVTSFDQVFNVFTLQEDDISAVTGRIDKAKRQIRRSLLKSRK